jgi:predicted HicB family RNase H-like nuclease
MPATKWVPNEAPVKASVFLDPKLHRAAKIAAMDQGIPLSDYIRHLVATALKWKEL